MADRRHADTTRAGDLPADATAPMPAAPAVSRRRRRISVLVPTYNHAAFIGEAIASVLGQDWPDLELRILDDGSQDGVLAVAEQALRGQTRVRYTLERQDNAGVSVTLNRLMAQADGDAIAILNSDDHYLPGRFSTMMERLEGQRRFFAFSRVAFIETGSPDDTDDVIAWHEEVVAKARALPTLGFRVLLGNQAVTSSNFLFSRDLAELTGGFAPALRLSEDWDFAVQCLHYVEPTLIDARLMNYRLHPANSWRKLNDIRVQQATTVLRRYFAPVSPRANPIAPSRNAWPRCFPMFLAIMHHVARRVRLAEIVREEGLAEDWPRLDGAPSEAEDRAAVARLIAAAHRQAG